MTTELRDTDLQQVIARENAKPDAAQRNHDLINWAQGILDDRANPGAAAAAKAFADLQSKEGIPTLNDPAPHMTAYLKRCVDRCQKAAGANKTPRGVR